MFPAVKPLLGALLGLAASAAVALEEEPDESLARVMERGVLQVAVYDAFPPFSDRDAAGKPAGIDVDIAHALAERLGVKAAIRFQPADESVEDDLRNAVWKGHYIGGGVADVMLHVPADPRFAAQVDQVKIDGVYYIEDVALAWDSERFSEAPGLGTFATSQVGVELETIADLYLLGALGGRLRDNVVHFHSLALATQALVEGQVPAVMGQRAEVQGLLRDHDRFNVTNVLIPGVMISSWPLGAAVKADNESLARAVMTAMRALVDDGTVSAIFDAHGATRTPLD